MKYSKKAIKIVEDTFEYLEGIYKGSEITFSLMIYSILKKCDTRNCEKQALKYLWNFWEFFDNEEYNYYKLYYKEIFGIEVV